MYDADGLAWIWTEKEDSTLVLEVCASRVAAPDHRPSVIFCRAHATEEPWAPERLTIREQEFEVRGPPPQRPLCSVEERVPQ
eukprot:3525622-Rhodomonas_salina.4